MGKFNYEAVKEAAKQLLIAMGQDVEREGLKETPRRIAGYWQELLEGEEYTNKEIAEKYSKNFEVGYDPIVTIYQENIYSHCEHHLALMFDGSAVIGYIPVKNENGTYKVLGLSKLYRIVEMCSKRLQLQENLASYIA